MQRPYIWIGLLSTMLLLGCDHKGEGEWLRRVDQANQRNDFKELKHFLHHPLALIRMRSIQHLAQHPSTAAFKIMQGFLRSASPTWRREVLVALFRSQRNDPNVYKLLQMFCTETDAELRTALLIELGNQLQIPHALRMCMMRSFLEEDALISHTAYTALGHHGWRNIPLIQTHFGQTSVKRHKALWVKLLRRITGYSWKYPQKWKGWFQKGHAELFQLRFARSSNSNRIRLLRALRSPHQDIRQEAARILSRWVTPRQGVEWLLKTQRPSNFVYAGLWGPHAAQMMWQRLRFHKRTITLQHIRTLGRLLPPHRYIWLLEAARPYPQASHQVIQTILSTLEHNIRRNGPSKGTWIHTVQNWAHHKDASIALTALRVLWSAGIWHSAYTERFSHMDRQLQGSHNLSHYTKTLRTLREWGTWTQQSGITRRWIKLLQKEKDLRKQRAILDALYAASFFKYNSRSITHSVLLGMRYPKQLGEHAFRMIMRAPLSTRIRWMRLFVPHMQAAQWIHFWKAFTTPNASIYTPQLLPLLKRSVRTYLTPSVQLAALNAIRFGQWKHALSIVHAQLLRPNHRTVQRALLKTIGSLGDPSSLSTLKQYVKRRYDRRLKWDLYIAQLQCGSKSSVQIIQKELARRKGVLWNAPVHLAQALLYAQQSKLLMMYAHRLHHIHSPSVAAAYFVHKPTYSSWSRLLKRLHNPLSLTSENRSVLEWLRIHHGTSFLRFSQRWLKTKANEKDQKGFFFVVDSWLKGALSKIQRTYILQFLAKQTKNPALALEIRLDAASLYTIYRRTSKPLSLDLLLRQMHKRGPIRLHARRTRALHILKRCEPFYRALNPIYLARTKTQIRSYIHILRDGLPCLDPSDARTQSILQGIQKTLQPTLHSSAESNALLGRMYAHLGNISRARDAYLRALHLRPTLRQQVRWSARLRDLLKRQSSKARPSSRPSSLPSPQGKNP